MTAALSGNDTDRWLWHDPQIQGFCSGKPVEIGSGEWSWPLFLCGNRWLRTLKTQGPCGPVRAKRTDARAIGDELIRAGKRLGAHRVQVQLTPTFACDQSWLAEHLLEHGFTEIPWFTTVVALRDEASVKNGLRRCFRRCWTQTSRVQIHHFVDEPLLRRLYETARISFARTGYPLEPWPVYQRHAEVIHSGRGVLFEYASEAGRAFVLVNTFNAKAYYSIGVSEDSALAESPNQKLQCAVLKYLLSAGYSHYDVGIVPGPKSPRVASDKETSIAHFKRGLGGELHAVPVWEKILSRPLEALVHTRRRVRERLSQKSRARVDQTTGAGE